MVCFRPIDAWKGPKGLQFTRSGSYSDLRATSIPCGKCMGCRISRQDDWATRIRLEGKLHPVNSFVTLTYAPEHLPLDYSLSKDHAVKWTKRLRRALEPHRIRFFLCAEYGAGNWRPHYHAIIFNYDFPDRTPWRVAPSGEPSFRSELLEKTWPLGHCEVGSFTPQSARYVAGYTLKKITGERALEHYRRMNPDTGEIHQVIPEFTLMSRNPGIGCGWYDENERDAFPSDFLIIDGERKPVPRYFHKKANDKKPMAMATVKIARRKAGRKPSRDKTPERMQAREEHAVHINNNRKKGELEE